MFEKIAARRLKDVQALDELYTELIQKRTELAKNASFNNYHYKFKEMGRFDYTKESCFEFLKPLKAYYPSRKS